jgi:hypothetical protein
MILCKLVGHRWRQVDAYRDGWVQACDRCGVESDDGGDDPDPIHVRLFWTAVILVVELASRLRKLIRPCPFCGRRFGRHRDDCIPY